MTAFRDCVRCEKLRRENESFERETMDAKKRAAATKRWNRVTLFSCTAAVACSVVIGGIAYGRAKMPPEPEKQPPCIESAVVISSDDSTRTCPPGGRLTATPLQVADKVLVRCHCGADAERDGGT